MTEPTLITPPTDWPVTIGDLRNHVRVAPDFFDDDVYIGELRAQAVEEVESRTWRRLCSQTWDQTFNTFKARLYLPFPPLSSASIKYTDTDEAEQTVASSVYETGDDLGRGFVRLKYNQLWPSDVLGHPDSVVVRFVCGYGDAVDVPARFKHAIRLLVGDAYNQRETIIVGTISGRIDGAISNLLSDHAREFV